MFPFTKEVLIKDFLQIQEDFQELEWVLFNIGSDARKQFQEWTKTAPDYFGKDMLVKAFEEEDLDGLDLHRWAWPQEPAKWEELVNDYVSLNYRRDELHRREVYLDNMIYSLIEMGQ